MTREVVLPGAGSLQAAPPLILVAEDDQANIELVSDYLQLEGYRVVVARDGGEAIERTREVRPDLILMDVQMPQMDGLEATRHIRSQAESVDIPIIALTAQAMHGDREACLAAGADDYISKPFSLSALVEAIERQLKREKQGKTGDKRE